MMMKYITTIISIISCMLMNIVLNKVYIIFNNNPESGVFLLRITGFVFVILIIGLLILVFYRWKYEHSIVSFLCIAVMLFFVHICFTAQAPDEHFEKTSIQFIEKNFNHYLEVASMLERRNVGKEYNLPKKYAFLSETGIVTIYDKNGLHFYEFDIRSRFLYSETLIYSPEDKSLYQNTEHFEVIKLKPKWYFIIEN